MHSNNTGVSAFERSVLCCDYQHVELSRNLQAPETGAPRGGIVVVVMHRTILFALLFAVCAAGARDNPARDQTQLPANYVPSGGQIYKQHCSACHGADAKGHGPERRVLRIPAPDLTTLAKRHGGKFPYAYVTGVLRFGPGFTSHGSAAMPIWGPLFEHYYNQSSAQQRIQNLCDYLATLQEK